MAQDQRPVDINFLDGSTGAAVATGNNASWTCLCTRSIPLLGRSGRVDQQVVEQYRIDCPDCTRSYIVNPEDKDQGVVSHIQEVIRPRRLSQ